MKRKVRLPMFVWCLLFLCLSLWIPTSAATTPQPDLSNAEAICIYHIADGRMVVSKNENETLPAGSLPKVMAGLLACETLGNRLNETVGVTSAMISSSQGRCSKFLGEGTKSQPVYSVSVAQLLYLALCGSYNDAYDVLAPVVSGSREAFVDRMNERASELGAEQTLFADPSGVQDTSRTTASDMIRIALKASENPLYMQITSAVRCDLFGEPFYNPNALLSAENALPENERSRYVDSRFRGMHAGETTKAGHCLATVAGEDGSDYLCVVLGGKASDEEGRPSTYSYLLTIRLMNWIGKNFSYRQLLNPEIAVCKIPVEGTGLQDSVEVVAKESLYAFLPADAEVSTSIRLAYDSLDAPVKEGMSVGYVILLYEGQTLGTAELYTAQSVERSGVSNRLSRIKELTASRRVRATLICFAVCTVLWIGIEVWAVVSRRHKWDKYFSQKLEAPEELARRERKRTKKEK